MDHFFHYSQKFSTVRAAWLCRVDPSSCIPTSGFLKKNFIEELKNNGMVQYSPIPLLQTTYKQFGNFPKADVFHSAHFRVAQLASPYKSSHRLTCDMIALA